MSNTRFCLTTILGLLVLTAIILRLFFWQGFLTIEVKPADSRVTIGKKPYPQGKIKLNPGTYRVGITKDGYIPFVKDIPVKTGLKSELNISLRNLPEPKLIDEGVLQIATNGQALFYLGNGGKTIYKYENGQKTSLTPDNLTDIKQVIWSPDFQLALLLRSKDAGLYDFKRYDLINQVYTSFYGEGGRTIGKDIKALAWSPQGDRIAYISAPATGEVSLFKAEPGNQNKELLADLRPYNLENPGLEWSKDGKYILITGKDILLFDTSTRTIARLTEGGKVAAAGFLAGDKILYASNSPDPTKTIKTDLSSMSLDGKNKTNLPLRSHLNQIALLKDPNQLLAWTDEGLVAFNLSSQTKTKYTYKGRLNPEFLVLAKDEKEIFYLENGKLYQLGLEKVEY